MKNKINRKEKIDNRLRNQIILIFSILFLFIGVHNFLICIHNIDIVYNNYNLMYDYNLPRLDDMSIDFKIYDIDYIYLKSLKSIIKSLYVSILGGIGLGYSIKNIGLRK